MWASVCISHRFRLHGRNRRLAFNQRQKILKKLRSRKIESYYQQILQINEYYSNHLQSLFQRTRHVHFRSAQNHQLLELIIRSFTTLLSTKQKLRRKPIRIISNLRHDLGLRRSLRVRRKILIPRILERKMPRNSLKKRQRNHFRLLRIP